MAFSSPSVVRALLMLAVALVGASRPEFLQGMPTPTRQLRQINYGHDCKATDEVDPRTGNLIINEETGDTYHYCDSDNYKACDNCANCGYPECPPPPPPPAPAPSPLPSPSPAPCAPAPGGVDIDAVVTSAKAAMEACSQAVLNGQQPTSYTAASVAALVKREGKTTWPELVCQPPLVATAVISKESEALGANGAAVNLVLALYADQLLVSEAPNSVTKN